MPYLGVVEKSHAEWFCQGERRSLSVAPPGELRPPTALKLSTGKTRLSPSSNIGRAFLRTVVIKRLHSRITRPETRYRYLQLALLTGFHAGSILSNGDIVFR